LVFIVFEAFDHIFDKVEVPLNFMLALQQQKQRHLLPAEHRHRPQLQLLHVMIIVDGLNDGVGCSFKHCVFLAVIADAHLLLKDFFALVEDKESGTFNSLLFHDVECREEAESGSADHVDLQVMVS
jgi:hypothetical protein